MSFILVSKKWLVTIIFLILYIVNILAIPFVKETINYGTIQVISLEDISEENYIILETGSGFIVVEVNGKKYYIDTSN